MLFLSKFFRMMKLTLGFSTCPNDTFIFDALVHGKIDTEGLEFEIVMADVEELNRRAFRHQIDITKLSFHAFAYVAGHYRLLNAGSALGRGNGPLLIAREPLAPEKISRLKIAIPGKYTTANLLFGVFFPEATHKTEYLFSDIENAVLTGEADAGVIIHENRFTYEKRGLVKIVDLGEAWESTTGRPIPLGGIAVSRQVPAELQQTIDRVISRSVAFALANPASGEAFIKQHAQELEEEVIWKHIGLYVNSFTQQLGQEGREAVARLLSEAAARQVIPALPADFFVDEA